MFTVVGAGFGVYGYLPALIECYGDAVILPEEYRAVVIARPELERYRAHIRWAADIASALERASAVVVAVRPASQPGVVVRCCEMPNITRLVLEKPLAVSPQLAGGVLATLARCGKRYRIGYTLLNTSWSRDLDWPQDASEGRHVRIDWSFMAHHFTHSLPTWKRAHSQGGGVLRFYGIHVVALLARQGYRDVAEASLAGAEPDQPSEWRARFSGPGLPDCSVSVDSRAGESTFAISAEAGRRRMVELRDPFDDPRGGARGGDRRIPVLVDFLETFRESDGAYLDLYERTNALWGAVEDAATTAVER